MVRSKREKQLDEVLTEMFPAYTMLQDYPITVGRKTLYIDRVVVGPNIAIEVDGKQHEQASEFFHRDKEGFYNSKANDKLKEMWCAMHDYVFVRFASAENITSKILRKKILSWKPPTS